MKGCFFYLYNNYINKKIQIEKSEKYIILCRKINLNLLLFFCYDFNAQTNCFTLYKDIYLSPCSLTYIVIHIHIYNTTIINKLKI